MHRLKLIEENYKKAIEHINRCLTDDRYPALQAITKLFMETDVNPYGFLPGHFADGFDTAGGMSSLLGMIHHALYDDGDISFPIVNGEPRIAFLHHTEDCYEDLILNETEKHFKKNYGHEYELKRCSDVFDFIQKFEEYHSKEVRNWFITEASRRSIEFAVEHFSNYARFDPDWEFDEQIIAEIQQNRQKLIANGMLKVQE